MSSRKPPSKSLDKERHEFSRIGPFEIAHEIGKGSFAVVYKGYRTTSDPQIPVAIKAVTRNKLTPKLQDNLESEIRLLKGISHRNVVELVECLKTDTHIYLIMAFSSAGDLSNYIRKRGLVDGLSIKLPSGHRRPIYDGFPHPKDGGLNETIARSFLGQLADALSFLRSRNIIHRDIKPQNLLLSPYPRDELGSAECQPGPDHIPGVPILKVADFGFARFLPQASMAETLCGSPLYMAPEILRYEKYDAKADLWSVGAVLYEMCTGRPPFRAQNHVELLRRIEKAEDKFKFPDERQSADETAEGREPGPATEVAPDIKVIIRKLLKRNPVERMSFVDFFEEARHVAMGGSAVGLGAIPRRNSAASRIGETLPDRTLPDSNIRSTSAEVKTVVKSSDSAAEPSTAATPSRTPSSSDQNKIRRSSFAPKYIVGQPVSISTEEDLQSAIASSRTPASVSPSPPRISPSNLKARDFALVAGPAPAAKSGSTLQSNALMDASTDGDSFLAREYVVIDKAPTQINALADEMSAASTKRPVNATRQTSKGFLSKPIGGPNQAGISSAGLPLSQPSPYPPNRSVESSTTPPFTYGAGSPRSRPAMISYGSSSPRVQTYAASSLAIANAAVHTPANAVAKAFNMASFRLFGSSRDGIMIRRPSARRKAIPRFGSGPNESAEIRLVVQLEDLAQKALVILDFADSRSQFAQSNAIADSSQAVVDPSDPFESRSRLTVSAESASAFAAAAEAYVLYIRSLAFLQQGIKQAKAFWEEQQTSTQDVGSDFNEAVQWLRARFNECYDRAEAARQRLGSQELPETAVFAEKLIYERALEISRAAAVNELMGDQPQDCEVAYETALYLLYGIIDDSVPDIEPVKEDDAGTINKFIESIQGRLAALRKKLIQ